MKKAKIMIVEDEFILAMKMESNLSGMGYETCGLAATGEDAIKNAEQEKPDVVLMDIILKGEMSGIDAAVEIHSRYGIPIIFTTGCEGEGIRELADEAGPVAYFIKPVEIEALRLAIEKAIQKENKSTNNNMQ